MNRHLLPFERHFHEKHDDYFQHSDEIPLRSQSIEPTPQKRASSVRAETPRRSTSPRRVEVGLKSLSEEKWLAFLKSLDAVDVELYLSPFPVSNPPAQGKLKPWLHQQEDILKALKGKYMELSDLMGKMDGWVDEREEHHQHNVQVEEEHAATELTPPPSPPATRKSRSASQPPVPQAAPLSDAEESDRRSRKRSRRY